MAESNTPFTEWEGLTSDIPTSHLSFLMMIGLPKRFFAQSQIVDKVKEIERALSRASNVDEDVVRNRVVGRFAGGYTIPDAVRLTTPPSIVNFDKTVDILVEIKKLKVSDLDQTEQGRKLFAKFDTSECRVGYTRLRVENAELSPTLCEGHDSVIFDKESGSFYVSSKYHRQSASSSTDTDGKGADGQVDEEKPYNYIHTVAFPCITWPKCAADWITRPRNGKWLDELLAETIASRGCHVIPLSHPSSGNPDVEWKLSFATAERSLAQEAVTIDQRRCFVFFLLLLSRMEKDKICLDFDHYLAMFLHVCEKIPLESWEETPGYCLMYMLEYLIQHMKERFLPQYFIPESNTIDVFTEDEISSTLESIEKLNKDLLSVYLDFADNHVFGFQCSHTPFSQIMKPVLDDMKAVLENKTVEKPIQEVCSSTLFNVAHELVEEGTSKKMFEAVNYLVELFPFFSKADPLLNSLPSFLDIFGQQLDSVSKAKTFYEEALRRSEEFPDLLTVKGNLACLTHAACYEFEDGSDERRDLLHRAEVLFREHMQSRHAQAGSHIDYINFLFMQCRYKDVICLCRKFLSSQAVEDSCQNAYSHLECNSVDDNMKTEIANNGYILAPSTSFAYYFMTQSCLILNDDENLTTETLKEFEDYCSKMDNSASLVLLGYCYKRCERWNDAVRCLKRAAILGDGYIVDQTLMTECERKAR